MVTKIFDKSCRLSYVLNLDDFSNFLVDRCYQFKLRYLELNILNLAPPIPRLWRVAKVTYAVIVVTVATRRDRAPSTRGSFFPVAQFSSSDSILPRT
jgi:hypothetical protein